MEYAAPLQARASVPSVIQAASVIQPASVIQSVAPTVRLDPFSVTQSNSEAESGQFGGSKTQKCIEFNETGCRRVFRNARLCKTFTRQDEYADLNIVLYSFREVIRRELLPNLA